MNLTVLAEVALVTLGAVALLFWTTYRVGSARKAHGVMPPACEGPEAFLRVFRVQQNTVEQLMLFLPSLWLCGIYFNPMVAALMGLVWLVARVFYVTGYSAATEKRLLPFLIALIVTVLLWVGAVFGVVQAAVLTA
jgi:glutathione S-transferase